MPWLKVDDNFPDHPKVAALPNDTVRWFHVRAMAYAARFQTRGEITPAAFKALKGKPGWAEKLVEVALWDTTSRGGWAIHDFDVYNPPRDSRTTAEISAQRAAAGRLGGQRSGEARREARALKQEANAEANLLRASEAPSRPVPSQETTSLSETSSLSPSERDFLETALSALPQKYRYDEMTRQEMELFASDFAGKHVELAAAISECRRSRELCFPGNLRKYMPGARERGNTNGQSGYGPRTNRQPNVTLAKPPEGRGRVPDVVVDD